MAALDRFGGPEAWDAYCDAQDKARERAAKAFTCLDCDECAPCPLEGYEEIGYCLETGEFVTNEQTVWEKFGEVACFKSGWA